MPAAWYSPLVGAVLECGRGVCEDAQGSIDFVCLAARAALLVKSRAGNPHGEASVCPLREPPEGGRASPRFPAAPNPAADNYSILSVPSPGGGYSLSPGWTRRPSPTA